MHQALLLILLLSPIPSFSFQYTTKADSLKALLQTAIDTTRVDLLNDLAKQFWQTKADTAQLYAKEALEEARKNNYLKGEAEAFRILGLSSNFHGNQVQARAYLKKAIHLFEQIGYEPGLAAALNNLGVVDDFSGNYEEGLQAHQQALTIFRELGNQEAVGSVLNYIGIIYQDQGNYEKAIEYCLQGLQIRQEIQDHAGIAFSLINVGNMYLAAKKFQTALDYYLESLAYAQERDLPSATYSRWQLGKTYGQLGQYDSALHFLNQVLEKDPNDNIALNLLGEIYLALQDYEVAQKYLLQSLSLLKEDNDRSLAYVQVLHNICKVYAAQHRYLEALAYAQKSLAISQETGAREETQAIALTLSEIYAGLQDFSQAYRYQQRYITLKDSITSEEYNRRLAVLEADLELSKKQTHIEVLTQQQQLQQQELKRQANLRNVFVVGLCFTLLLGLFIVRNISLKRKAELLLKARLESDLELERMEKAQKEVSFQSRTAELEMMALRAQMNPHFIFNCLNSINRFILKNEPETASDYLTKFSRLIRLILQNSQSMYVSLESELEALRLYLEMEVSRFEGQFDYRINFDPDLEIEDLEVPPLIIQPFVENAIWHGLMHKEDLGHLLIELRRENDMLYCQITDDGVGRQRAAELKSKSASKNKSLGMRITAHRLALINTLNEKATTVEVTDLMDASGQACGTRILLKIPV